MKDCDHMLKDMNNCPGAASRKRAMDRSSFYQRELSASNKTTEDLQ